MKLKERLQPYKVKKQKLYTVSETVTTAYIYKIMASTEKEAINKVKTGIAIKDYEFTTDIFYQIEN